MHNNVILMGKLEGVELLAYDCSLGYRTVGIGFNMEQIGAKKVWSKLDIKEDFDEVFNRDIEISMDTATKLFNKVWKWCEKTASQRCNILGLSYRSMPEYKRFILADIAYNTGSVKKWRKVFLHKNPRDVLFEARRSPKELMDSRVAKAGYYFGIIKDLEDAHKLGLVYAKYLK